MLRRSTPFLRLLLLVSHLESRFLGSCASSALLFSFGLVAVAAVIVISEFFLAFLGGRVDFFWRQRWNLPLAGIEHIVS